MNYDTISPLFKVTGINLKRIIKGMLQKWNMPFIIKLVGSKNKGNYNN